MNRVTELLNTKYPVIQGPMGVISSPELVSAVSNAGGFGIMGSAFITDPEDLRTQIKSAFSMTHNPFGVNIHLMNPNAMCFAEIIIEEGVPAVTLSGGSPKGILPILKENGIKSIAVVPTSDIAQKAEDAGVGAVVAEGWESGGMQGFNGVATMILIPETVDAVDIPVIAAGGIADSRGYKAAFALGAEGVQLGTRFIASAECIAHENYKNAIKDSESTEAILLNLGRINVRAVNKGLASEVQTSRKSLHIKDFNPDSVEKSWLGGDLESGIIPAGQVTGIIREISTVKEIIEGLVSTE